MSSISGFVDAKLNDVWNSRLEVGHSEDKRDTGNDSPWLLTMCFQLLDLS